MTQIGNHDDAYLSTPLEEKLAWFQNAPGLSAVEPASQFMAGAAALYTDSDSQVRATMRSLGADWTGDAATNAGATLQRAADWSQGAGAGNSAGGETVEGYGKSFESLRGQVHWDDPWAWGWNDTASAAASVATLDPAIFLGNLTTDYFTTAQQNRTNDAAAVAALRAHEQQTRTAVESFPALAPAGIDPSAADSSVSPAGPHPGDGLRATATTPAGAATTVGAGAVDLGVAGALGGGLAAGLGAAAGIVGRAGVGGNAGSIGSVGGATTGPLGASGAPAGSPGAAAAGPAGRGGGGPGAGGVGGSGSGGLGAGRPSGGGTGGPGAGGLGAGRGGTGGLDAGGLGAGGLRPDALGAGGRSAGGPGAGGSGAGGSGAGGSGAGGSGAGGLGRDGSTARGGLPGGPGGVADRVPVTGTPGVAPPRGSMDGLASRVGLPGETGVGLRPADPLGRVTAPPLGSESPGNAGGWRDVVSRGPTSGNEFAARLPSGSPEAVPSAGTRVGAAGTGMPFLGGMGAGAGARSTEHRHAYWIRSSDPFDVPLPPHGDGLLQGDGE